MPSPNTVTQMRIAYAVGKVDGVTDLAKYRDIARKLPSMLQTNGLGEAQAFLMGKNPELAAHLTEWLCERMPAPVYPDGAGKDRLLRQIGAGSRYQLLRATAEAKELATWLKRFADARETQKLGGGLANDGGETTSSDGEQPGEVPKGTVSSAKPEATDA